MFLTLIPCAATGIDIRKEGTVQHGGARMPSATKVAADYDNGIVTLNVTGYTGNAQVSVSDREGNIVGYTFGFISNKGTVNLNIGTVSHGCYNLDIVLNSVSYCGMFFI